MSDSQHPFTAPGPRYRILWRAGKGGMASVFRAVREGVAGFNRVVGLKRLLPTLVQNEQFVALFIEEARVCARLDHPHIVQVHDFGKDRGGSHYLVMEWVEGTDLYAWLRHQAGPTDWALLFTIICDVLDALDYAHRHTRDAGDRAPIIHRDISPGNVLIGLHGHAKLADFGLARAMDRKRITRRGVLKGKVGYMAPELIELADPSPGSDIYSVGVVLWEGLTQRRLFEAETDFEVLKKVRVGAVPDVRKLRPELPPRIGEILDKALARRPYDRYQHARDMQADMLQCLFEHAGPTARLAVARSVAEVRQRAGRNSGFDMRAMTSQATPVPTTESLEQDLAELEPESGTAPIELVPLLRSDD